MELNDRVKDKVTGYGGRVTAKSEYITGETRYLVENVDSTGRPIEWWFDESRLEKAPDTIRLNYLKED